MSKATVSIVMTLVWCSIAGAQKWSTIATPPQFTPGVALQLTDGTVLIEQYQSSNWWKLTPQPFTLNYQQGKLTGVQPFPTSMNYAPKFFASAMLPDGRVIVEGGEYNNGVKDWTTLGAVYDPTVGSLGTWTPVSPPPGWTKIGDVQSAVLADGTFMMANKCPLPCTTSNPPAAAALFNAKAFPIPPYWTLLTPTSGFKNKFDENTEEGWTLLPNGNLLTVDTYVPLGSSIGNDSETYDPATGVWSFAGPTGPQLWDSHVTCGGASSHEIGPAVLRYDGTVFATGANSCPGAAGSTAIYDTVSRIWRAGPNIPGTNNMLDASASILTNGNVLVDTSPGNNIGPSKFYEFNGTGWLNIPQPLGLPPKQSTEGGRMLVLASGQILFTQLGTSQIWFYTPGGTYQPAWQPTICPSVPTCYPANGSIGGTYKLMGTQFNGLSQGAAYGDDAQSATNYPLVVITNDSTGHKFFARTHDFSTMAVATGSSMVSCQFTILPGTETGNSTLTVIANGIPSAPVGIVIDQ